MILIGTMNLTRTRDRGNFYCPTCGVTAGYRLRARRPFLTLYFIPVIPIGGAELSVRCEECRSDWDVSVLTMDRATHETARSEQFRDEALKSAILVVLEDDTISEDEIASLLQLSGELLQRPLDREELGQLCSIARDNNVKARNYVLTVSKRWSGQQRVLALQAMFLAATAGGELTPRRLKLLAELQKVLDLTDAEYQTAIEQVIREE